MRIDGYIHAIRRESWDRFDDQGQPIKDQGDYRYTWWSHEDMSTANYVMVCPLAIEFDLPDGFNPVPVEIANYRKEQQRIRAEAESKVNLLEEQISKLLSLEFKG